MAIIAALLALFAGACFGATAFIQRIGLSHLDLRLATITAIGTMAAIGWLFAPWFIEFDWFWTKSALVFALCGLLFPAFSQSLQILGVAKVGPTLTSALGSIAPVFAIGPAIYFLGESLSYQAAIGICIVLSGLVLTAFSAGSPTTRNWTLIALLIPIGASAARGVIQPAAKYGMLDVPSPYFATLIMVTVSTFVVALRFIGANPRRMVQSPKGYAIFALSGFVVGIGILALNIAINLGSVTLAAPLASTVPLWALFWGTFVFKSEKIGFHQVFLALLVVIGVVLVVTR